MLRITLVLLSMLLHTIASSERTWSQMIMAPQGSTSSSGTVAGMSLSLNFCNPAQGKTDGLQMTVHPPLVYGAGYQKWVVEFSRVDGKVFDADRELRLKLMHGYDANSSGHIEQNVVLPQGKLVGTADFVAPKWNNSYYWTIKVLQGNRELHGLNTNINYIARVGQNFGAADGSTDMLIVTREKGFDSPSYLEEHVGQLTELLELLGKCRQRQLLLENWDAMSKTQQDRYLAFDSKLPTNWLELARFGSIWIPIEAFETLQPEQLRALRLYTMGGGALVVTRVLGPQPEHDLLMRRLGQHSSEESPFEGTDASISSAPKQAWSSLAPVHNDIYFTNFGMGIVCTLPNRSMKLDMEHFAAVQGLVSSHSSWQLLRGTNKEFNAGTNYWDWLIPDIGRPPVWAFVGLIIVFAGVAGPSLLYFTAKARRASWLLFLFPALALIATTLLFSYAILHDGFDTLSRVRSFTWYDAKNDEGFAWSRQTFFSGTFLRDGLQVPSDAEISPMNWQNEYSEWNAKSAPAAILRDDRHVIRDLLPAREQRQFLFRHPTPTMRLFRVLPAEESIQVENLSDGLWKLAVFVDAEDRWWYAEGVAAGATAVMTMAPKDDVKSKLHSFYRASEPNLPPGLAQGQQVSMLDFWQSGDSLLSWSSYPPLMETAISKATSLDADLHANEFAMITESSSHLAKPIPAAKESHSFHVIAGKW